MTSEFYGTNSSTFVREILGLNSTGTRKFRGLFTSYKATSKTYIQFNNALGRKYFDVNNKIASSFLSFEISVAKVLGVSFEALRELAVAVAPPMNPQKPISCIESIYMEAFNLFTTINESFRSLVVELLDEYGIDYNYEA